MATGRLRKKIGKGRHASTIKRDRQNKKHAERNRAARSKLKTAIKTVRLEATRENLTRALPIIARAVSKGIIPKRRGARLSSRLTKLVNKSAAPAV